LGEVLGIDPQLFLDDLDVRLGGAALAGDRGPCAGAANPIRYTWR
jgi:hypothetical protein